MMNPKKIKRLHEFISAEPTIKPKTPVAPPTTTPTTRPGRPVPTKRPGEKEKGKPMAGTETKPRTPVAPPTTRPTTRPGRPVPTKRPGEKEKGKPMASAEELLDQFFMLLDEEKGTKFGQKIIKKLYNKYAEESE